MKKSFFDLGTGKQSNKITSTGCTECRCNYDCENPKMTFKKNDSKILIVLESPSNEEDSNRMGLTGQSGNWFREFLQSNFPDYQFNFTYAVKCQTDVNDVTIKHCNCYLQKDIYDIKPKIIIPVGTTATKAMLLEKISGRLTGIEYSAYNGEQIPVDNYYICPTFAHYIVYANKEKDCNYERILKTDIQNAINLLDQPVINYEKEFNKNIQVLYEKSEIEKAMAKLGDIVAFDYETTGLKPHNRSWHEIVTFSASDGINTVAFPIYQENKQILKDFLQSYKKKIAHKLDFEDMWSYFGLNINVNNWYWDTLIASHCLHNKKPTGLKYQIFSKFGLVYDSKVDEYLKSSKSDKEKYGCNAANSIKKAKLEDLLYYNALDSLYTYKLYEVQKQQFLQLPDKLFDGFKFFIEGSKALARVQRNGIRIDLEELEKQEAILEKRASFYYDKIMNSEELKKWRGKSRFNPNSNQDMLKILKLLGHKVKNADEKQLDKLNTLFTTNILNYRKTLKMKNTYLAQFKREVAENSYIYPFFNLHIAKSFRSSADAPSFQNLPKRDVEAKKRIRSLLYADKNCKLIEYDYSGVEVRISACYNKDTNLINYILNKNNDMHRDTAADIFMKNPKDITKAERQIGKNKYVFPSFYGSTYKAIAPEIWDVLEKDKELKAHMKSKGIKTYTQLESHIKNVEDIFWNKRFFEYKQWKNRIWKRYQKYGYIDSYTGFRYQDIMQFTEVTNYGIQGSAFHCLLYTLIEVQKKLDSGAFPGCKIIGQIHDSLVCSVNPECEKQFDDYVKYVSTQKIREVFKWINIDLSIDKELTEINGSWSELQEDEKF